MTVKGYGGDILYQVGFKDGKFSGFNVITHGETSTYGGIVLAESGRLIDERIKGQDVESDLLVLLNGSDNLTVGKSVTRTALINSLTNCVNDYLTEVQ